MDISFRRLAALALLLFAASQVIIFIEVTHDADRTGQTFIGIFFAVAVGVALVVDRSDRWWASALGLVAALLATLMDAPYADHVLSFDAAWEFAPVTLALLGSISAAVLAAADLVQRRRRAATDAHPAVAPAFGAIVVAAVTLIAVSFAVTLSSVENVGASERKGATVVRMTELKFRPRDLTASAGQPLKLVVENDDLSPHTFALSAPGADVDERFNAGDEKLVAFTVSSPGTYIFSCNIEGHEKMKGTLLVR